MAFLMVLGLVRFRVNLVCQTLARIAFAVAGITPAIELSAEEKGALVPFNKVGDNFHFARTPAMLTEEVKGEPRRQGVKGDCEWGHWWAGAVYEECGCLQSSA